MVVSPLFRAGLAAAALALVAACSPGPTAPSPVPSGLQLGTIALEPPPVPPRVGFNPPRALGATGFLAFGDSITTGVLSSFDGRFLFDGTAQSYPTRLQLALNTHHSPQTFTVRNEGSPGEWAQNAVTRFRTVLETHRPQAVLLLHGINDLSNDQPVSSVTAALNQMLDLAALFRTPVVIATMFQTYAVTNPSGVPRENGASRVPAYNTAVRQLPTGRSNVYLVDLAPVFTRDLVGGDGLHPTPQGYEVIATAFLTAIENNFPVRGSFQ